MRVGTLPSGKTVIGTYAIGGGKENYSRDSITFGGYTLSAAPTAHYIKEGESAPAACAGGTAEDPKAQPGNLCIFEGVQSHAKTASRGFFNPRSDSTESVLPFGAGVYANCLEECLVEGTWAVTAP
jgi:hypothetical protein